MEAFWMWSYRKTSVELHLKCTYRDFRLWSTFSSFET